VTSPWNFSLSESKGISSDLLKNSCSPSNNNNALNNS
jgi:hypothetical protein